MDEASRWPAGGSAVVFGSTGGIGSALLAALERRGDFARVIGFSRRSDPPIDLQDEASLARAVDLAAAAGEIRLAIDATGFLHDAGQQPEKSLRALDPDSLARSFALNAIGPALLMKHLLPRLPREGKAVFATLSARVGSIGDNRLGGWYAYRAAKAALNQLVRSAAIELRRTHPHAVCLALHPGTVDTSLSKPFSRSGLDILSPDESARRLLAVIDASTAADSGAFRAYDGTAIPW